MIDTRRGKFAPGNAPGISVLPLHEFASERVRLIRFAAGARSKHHGHPGGEEVLVLEGAFQDGQGSYPAGSWIRSPDGSGHEPYSEGGCLLYVKTGHLEDQG